MKNILSTLQRISDSLERIGEDMRTEEQVYQAELADRLAKGLTGDDAIKHYNEWMIKAGMKHLTV
ncbi:hypothetical protein [Bacteroides pyogenes]|uniref:hypothetical protein n=1 Tax=Bacteroides pyogenes TaxID=310300 RepID=UPI002FD89AC3